MKLEIKLSIALVMSLMLVACGGGSSDPVVKTEKVWKLKEKVLPNGEKITFDYNGSGNIIRQNNTTRGSHVEFNYDDKGILLTRENFLSSGQKQYHVEFDSHGEVTSRSNSAGVVLISYDNTYDLDRVIPDGASKRNHTETYQNSYLRVYPDSKLVSRVRTGTIERTEKFSYLGNNRVQASYFNSNDLVSDLVIIYTYENGNIVKFERDEDGERGPKEMKVYYEYDYTYVHDADGNLKSSTLTRANGNEEVTTYKWESMDIPVK